jgi:hypothetical protein
LDQNIGLKLIGRNKNGVAINGVKECSICEKKKPFLDFYSTNKHSKSNGDYIYYFPYCKECSTEKALKWTKDNPETSRALNKKYDSSEKRLAKKRERGLNFVKSGKSKDWQRKNKDKLVLYASKRADKEHNISKLSWEKCKEYFDFACAYCGMSEIDHKEKFKQQLHKEHVIHDGRSDIKNCVPSCKSCNSSKHVKTLNQWYSVFNPIFSRERYLKIYQWIRFDSKKIKHDIN